MIREVKSIRSTDDLMLRLASEEGAIGYIVMWLLGVPAGLLFLIFLMRGCT